MSVRAVAIVLVAAVLAIAVTAPAQVQTVSRPASLSRSIVIDATPIASFHPSQPDQRRFGALEFRGGLVLSSRAREFGGLSGMVMAPDGASFLALSDRANWFSGKIVYDGTRPVAITGSRVSPILGPDGLPLAARRWWDTESLTGDGTTLYVGLEHVDRIVRFDYGKNGVLARGKPLDLPNIKGLRRNQGLEGLALVPKGQAPLGGTLLAFTERTLDDSGNLRAFLIGGPMPGNFTVRRTDNFDISDAAMLPSGDVLILERKFSLLEGLGIRLRRLPITAIKPNALVDGPVLFDVDFGYEVDNMEALGVHTASDGAVVLTMLSDDNFYFFQRTLLLQFTLLDE